MNHPTNTSPRRRWGKTASATVLTLLLGTLVVLAFKYDGKPFTEVELNDGGVWVTNRDLGLTARLNPQIKELDLGVDAASKDFDIFQRATNLYLSDGSAARAVKPVDIPRAAALDPTMLPSGAVVAYGGDTFAVVDPDSGKAWVRPSGQLVGFSVKSTPPDVEDAISATVGTDGRAYVLRRDGKVEPFTFDKGVPVAEDEIDLGGDVATDDAAMLSLTVVGDTPVLFNRSTAELNRPGADAIGVETSDTTAVELQAPSDDNNELYVATREGLYRAALDGGKLSKISRGDVNGAPAAPVVLTSSQCVYAAWSDPDSVNNYLRDCANDANDDTEKIEHMAPDATLTFRVNREVVVLNDTATGDTWLVQEPGKAKINNWPAVIPNHKNKSKLKETTKEKPDQENRPPEPQDDDLGARPGRETVLPVVALNDHDPDDDIISISKTQYISGPEVEVKIVGGGTQLQVAVRADAEGTAVFRYYVTDGRVNEEVYAEVRLQILDTAQHAKPKLMPDREPRLTVAKGRTASTYLLADFFDPDGDDLTLTKVTSRGGEVDFRPDGTITFTDDGSGAKVSEIEYVIEDGFDSITGKLPVQVLGDSAPPELVPDLASGIADTQVVVQPLTNDRNPEGRDLTLKSVKVIGDDTGTEISKDLDGGTFTFKSIKAKTYYLEYTAYNSSATKSSQIRLDIESPPKDNRPPVAVRDKAVITPGGSAQVDLLLNDLDPDGDVLVIKRIGRPSIPGVKVSVVDKRLAVVTSATDIVGQQATVEYTVSDGRSSVTGTLVVAQRRSDLGNRHPVANKDQATVRAGSVTTIPVLGNDSDPDGGRPRLFQSDLDPQGLNVWVAGDVLRLRAPDKPGSYSIIYGVRDVDGLKASTTVSIFVIADSAKNNQAPVPQPIIDRVISGRPKVISVDLGGADPDGDSVAFASIETAPKLGRILETGVDFIRYEAFEGKTGTDFFQIRVQDKYGKEGVAEVRVGVVPEETENQPPVALDDNVLVQPNRTISYNVLTNDVDPDDDPLRITELNTRTDAKHENGFIEVAVGKAPESGTAATNIGYTIEDGAGAQDNAVFKVSVSRTAPFYAPIARDDVAELGDVIGREPGDKVEVEVLDNDLDFDGAKADLRVSGCDAGDDGECEVIDGDSAVEVTLKKKDQVVLYRLDDADEKSAVTYGVIYVTGTENVPPQLTTDSDKVPVAAVEAETKVIDLTDLVVTRAGRKPSILPGVRPTAINGRVSPVQGESTSLEFTPARGHIGPASVTLEVTDGTTAGEDAALTSLLTIPIDVKPAGNAAPVMRDGAIDVTRDGDAAEVDLSGLTRDANEGDLDAMTYTVRSAEPGLSARIHQDDSILSIKAEGSAKDGETLRIEVVADDGNGGTDEAVISVRVVSSSLPLTQVPLISVTARKGEETSVDIDGYAVNPYDGEQLKVSDPRVEGTGKFTDLRTEDSSVWFTPTSSGTSTIKVTVADASGDAKRNVPARIQVTVVSEPDAPQRPTLSSVEASSAVLSWREPDDNGAAIEAYEVIGSNGYTQSCAATTCALNGLTPGKTYTFKVRAQNAKGWSKESPPSEEITPNEAPDLMTPPTIVVESKPTGSRMDRQLTVRWKTPNNEGSPITAYEIKEAGSGRTWQATGQETSKVISGLANGTPYAFEIRAINDVTPPRDYSNASQAVAPFGVPVRSGAAPTLTVSSADDYTRQPFVKVDWTAWSESQSNGNAVSTYVINCNGCNRSSYEVRGPATSRTFEGPDGIQKGKTVTFTISATNDAGTSDASPSAAGRPYTKAGPVRNLTEAAASPSDRVAKIGWDAPADDGGLRIEYYRVQTNTGFSVRVDSAPGPNGAAVTFPSNGEHSITVQAITSNGGRAVEGEPSQSLNVDTWGKPDPPSASSQTSSDHYQVDIPITPGSQNGKSVTGVQYKAAGGAWTDLPSGRYTAEVPQGGVTHTIEVRTASSAPDDGRRFSDAISVTGTSLAKVLDITINCLGSVCRLDVSGSGFLRQDNASFVDLTGNLNIRNLDSCDSLREVVQGSFNYRVGGNGCTFAGTGSAIVRVGGVSDTVTNP